MFPKASGQQSQRVSFVSDKYGDNPLVHNSTRSPRARTPPRTKPVWVMKKKPVPKITRLSSMPNSGKHTPKSQLSAATSATSAKPKRSVSAAKKTECWKSLQVDAIDQESMSMWLAPTEASIRAPPIELIYKDAPQASTVQQAYASSYTKERNALLNWEKAKSVREKCEKIQMEKTGRSKGRIINRRDLNLNRTEPDGQERNHWKVERAETPDVFPDTAFFRVEEEKCNGLQRKLDKREMGYNVVEDTMCCPNLDDLSLIRSSKSDIYQNGGTITINPSFAPMVNDLFVNGQSYTQTQEEIKKTNKLHKLCNRQGVGFLGKGASREGGALFGAMQKGKKWNPRRKATLMVQELNDNKSCQSQACIEFGNHYLCFSRDPDAANQEFVVQAGACTAVGESAMSHVFMINRGTTLIHYTWSKVTRSDPLGTFRYIKDHFTFDSWGGTILPGETYRIPILYKSNMTGYFTEDWKLQTQPVMENGASIILRLWGLSKAYDPYLISRNKIDESLKSKIPLSICENQMSKIVDFLPLTEEPYRDIGFPVYELGPDLFSNLNPKLIYNTASVYRLEKLLKYLTYRRDQSQSYQQQQQLRAHIQSLVSSEITGVDSAIMEDRSLSMTMSDYEDQYESYEFDYEDIDSQIEADSRNDSLIIMCSKEKISTVKFLRKLIQPEYRGPDIEEVVKMNTEGPGEGSVVMLNDSYTGDTKSQTKESTKATSKRTSKRPSSGAREASQTQGNTADHKFTCNFRVEDIHNMILTDSGAYAAQEAFFTIFVTELDKLHFRPFLSKGDWRSTVCFTALSAAMDDFDSFAIRLKKTCCRAEVINRRIDEDNLLSHPLTNYEDDVSETSSSPVVVDKSHIVDKVERKKPRGSEEMNCFIKQANDAFSSARYKNQYMNRLHGRMYQLLSDFFDTMGTLLGDVETAEFDYAKGTFAKIPYTNMPFRIEDVLKQSKALSRPLWEDISKKIEVNNINFVLRKGHCFPHRKSKTNLETREVDRVKLNAKEKRSHTAIH